MDVQNEIKKLREQTGMNRKQFCEYFEIPYRTVTEWERGTRKMPAYVLRLLIYRVKHQCWELSVNLRTLNRFTCSLKIK